MVKIKEVLIIFSILLLFTGIGSAVNEPTNLISTGKETSKSIEVSWSPNPDWYNTSVYIDSVFAVNYTTNVSSQTHEFTGLTANTLYNISIQSYNDTYVISDFVYVDVTTLNTASGTMLPIWQLINNMVDNTKSIIGLIMLSIVIIIALTVAGYILNITSKIGK